MRQEILAACRDEVLYGFISNNHHRLTREELVILLKEVAFLLNDHEISARELIEPLEDELV